MGHWAQEENQKSDKKDQMILNILWLEKLSVLLNLLLTLILCQLPAPKSGIYQQKVK